MNVVRIKVQPMTRESFALYGILIDSRGSVEIGLGEGKPSLTGTTSERPNWKLALPFPLEEIESHPGLRALAEIMGAERALG